MATVFPSDTAIVLGGGLAGMATANTILENGGKVVLLDKSAFCGGNSTKATSGINGANTKTQRDNGIEDSIELFSNDCLKGGAKKPELVKVLAANSGPDCDWLMEVFGLDLSLVARLGGHSAPRTHRGKERFPGMTITYALIQMVEKVSETTDLARVVTKARATKLLQNKAGAVVGVEYEKGGQLLQEHGPVVIATGGFGADFSSDSLLAKYRPDLMHLSTSNGEHCTGDGIKMGEAIGCRTVDLEWVQVHPTGLVNPKDPEAKVKFLAAEALRGVGGLIFNADGERFANELGRRDYVTGEMWKNKGPYRLCLNKAASDEIIWHCKHYTGRGVMKYYESGEALARDMGVDPKVMAAATQAHYEAAKKQEADPEGGPYPAYPSGKTWDEPSGKTGSGKKFFHNLITGEQFMKEPFYVAIITPIIHYCMGGLEITTKSEVLGKDKKPVPGLYCAGECMGGVHGNNRLGGNSLLDCVVYGRVAGKAVSQYMLGGKLKATSLKDLTKGGVAGGGTQKSALSGGSYEDNMNDSKPAAAAAAASVAATAGGGGFTLEEVAKHNTEQDCWVVVNGQVLDVTDFLKDHPGGALAILTFAGKDATEEFNMIHPGDVIEKYAPDAIIGTIGGGGAAEAAGGGGEALSALPAGQNYYTMEEVAKHTSEKDCWVVVDGQVLDVTKFLPDHPGGALAIMTFAGKDATEEFNMIHPGDVIEKYAPHAIIGKVGSPPAPGAVAAGAKPAAGGGLTAPLLSKGGDAIANEHAWGSWRHQAVEENPGVFIVNVMQYIYAAMDMASSFMLEIVKTIFSSTNIKFTNDRSGLTRSAIFLIMFMVIHAIGNLHIFLGPDDFNGYGYFYVRLYFTGFGLSANIVEEYCALAALLHVAVALKRTWDINRNYPLNSGKLNLFVTGILLLTFMVIHLFQFRFGETQEYLVRPPPYFINFSGILKLQLFWTEDTTVAPVPVRDIYKMEFDLFQSPVWVVFYLFSVVVFLAHACLGWQKLVPASAFKIPKAQQARVKNIGYAIFAFIALCYISFPTYCFFFPMKKGNLGQI